MVRPTAICFKLLAHWMRLARSLALASAGNSIAARMAIMAMTTRSSINVKPFRARSRLSDDDFNLCLCQNGQWSIIVGAAEDVELLRHVRQHRVGADEREVGRAEH